MSLLILVTITVEIFFASFLLFLLYRQKFSFVHQFSLYRHHTSGYYHILISSLQVVGRVHSGYHCLYPNGIPGLMGINSAIKFFIIGSINLN